MILYKNRAQTKRVRNLESHCPYNGLINTNHYSPTIEAAVTWIDPGVLSV